jgi:hypothetical protein
MSRRQASSGSHKRTPPTREVVDSIRCQVLGSLSSQGFVVRDGRIVPPAADDKDGLRSLHAAAVAHRRRRAQPYLQRHESTLLEQIASGSSIQTGAINPRLEEVRRGTADERLFRWAALHWSIPVSSGYGRRLRYLVRDATNDKLIGLIGLGDPVFSLACRDRWIGWSAAQRGKTLAHVADAFVLGAVPPYSYLLAGKLVAMLATSAEVVARWTEKYSGRQALLSERRHDGQLMAITTSSALGRSSVYNRLRVGDRTLFYPVGYTRGSGEFHFSDGLHRVITEFAVEYCAPTAKAEKWGTGFRNRREIVKKALPLLGFSDQLIYHGVEREVFVAPLAANACEFLRGETTEAAGGPPPASQLITHWQERWLTPRLTHERRYQRFDPEDWRLWPPTT